MFKPAHCLLRTFLDTNKTDWSETGVYAEYGCSEYNPRGMTWHHVHITFRFSEGAIITRPHQTRKRNSFVAIREK